MEALALICPLLYFAMIAIVIAGIWKVFSKAGQPGWAALVPIYNTYILVVEIAKKDMMWFVLSLFVPFAVVVPLMDLAEKFGKDRTYGIGLLLLPFIFFPMLGFGDAQYRGGKSKALDFDDEEDEEPRPRKKKRPADDEE